ncbi:hypothetical protein BCR39DRAFT_548802 [Naematelia encephala]|uniref:RRM domain-containing protein n=1 Tax=Naematelia encephala TaxID=71784 RepID=A0A1Y2AMH1_9TREE|nr:hypothetical protein BCR39DRAFT_548802 [Naematelia encephala]
MPPAAAKTIFVANIPYDVSEEQLAGVFAEAGPVSNVEIKFDPATGRSKGYAFVQFYDEATAASAVRNLQEVPVNGRNLRVELSTDEPGPRTRGGRGGGGGRPSGGRKDETPPFRGTPSGSVPPPGAYGADDIRVDMSLLPPGVDPLPGQKSTDAISKTLAGINPGQMQEVMNSMKTLIASNPAQARAMLHEMPQLAYALFQAMLLMNIVDPSVLQRIQPLPPAHVPAPTPAYPPAGPPQAAFPPFPPQAQQAPPPSYPPYAGASSTPPYRPPPPPAQQGYGAPPPAQSYQPPQGYGAPPPQPAAGLPPNVQAALSGLPEDQRTMLVQVLSLTPEQISALDVGQQASIRQLRQQFLGTA